MYVVTGGSISQMFQSVLLGSLISMVGSKKVHSSMTRLSQKDLVFMKEFLEAGKVVPVIDRCYPLREAAEAVRYVEEGHAKGKVVIAVDQNSL